MNHDIQETADHGADNQHGCDKKPWQRAERLYQFHLLLFFSDEDRDLQATA
jgi:hypothetical protein